MIKGLENKFIVINKKRFEEILDHAGFFGARRIEKLLKALSSFENYYERATGKKMNQEYIVINQDEPYAEKVVQLVLENEK